MQAGTMSHYEFGQTLFIYGGQQTKHTVQSDADTGLPTLMPWTESVERECAAARPKKKARRK